MNDAELRAAERAHTDVPAEPTAEPQAAAEPPPGGGSAADVIRQADATQLAKLVAGATDEQLAEGMADPEGRRATLDEIFRRMAEHVDADKARGNDAVIHWRITERPGGGEDHYEVVLEGGRCTVSEQPAREPRISFTIGPVDFLRLVSGNVAGPMLFMSGKLRIAGDLMFAAQLAALFTIPRPN